MAFQITYEEAKRLTLEFLNDWMKKLPAAQRTAPIIIFDMKSWSIPQMIAQVQSQTEIGQRYVYFYIGSLKKYVIKP
jgi:hypothetical protein